MVAGAAAEAAIICGEKFSRESERENHVSARRVAFGRVFGYGQVSEEEQKYINWIMSMILVRQGCNNLYYVRIV